MIVDSHVHIWDLDRGRYPWLGPQHGDLYRSFGPEEALAALDAAGVDVGVLVQAEDSWEETLRLADAARAHPRFVGVVGWLPLEHPGRVERLLAASPPALRGVRTLVHDDPRDGVLLEPRVLDSLRMVAAAGLPFEVPDAFPRLLGDVPLLAERVPELTVVVDHLAKPPAEGARFALWRDGLRAAARSPRVLGKLSGLQGRDRPLTRPRAEALLRTALEVFGADRLIYGGDWPMTERAGGHLPTWAAMRAAVAALSRDERAAILGGTARHTYDLASLTSYECVP